jgi:hypothetical protein
MKGFIIASAVAATLALGLPTAAQAHDVGFRLFFGFPHYSYRVGPDYIYRPGYGWYRPGYRARARLSCASARAVVRNNGYRNVSTVECGGSTFTFRGTRNGKRHVVYVNSRSGGMWRG